MSFPPDVYLIGAQKAGTTTLAHLLSQHSDICVAKTKEPHYFTGNSDRGLGWYRQQFLNRDAICIDASTSYSFAPLSKNNSYMIKKQFHNIPQRIHALNPQAKFIYLLREPVARVYSGYWHSFNTGREHKGFAEAIARDSFYLDVSDYYSQLSLWLEYFPLDSFLFLLFEQMKQNPQTTITSCCQFLKIDPAKIAINLEHRNKTDNVNYIGRKFNRLFKKLDYTGMGYFAPAAVRNLVREHTRSHQSLPAIPLRERDLLRNYFADKNRSLAELTGLTLSQWQS